MVFNARTGGGVFELGHVLNTLAAAIIGLIPSNGSAMVVTSDYGGRLSERVAEIRDLRESGERVELRGTCMSACTMYLSLPNACIAASASFGFHGPSYRGKKLDDRLFQYWSNVMASHYREPLRSWFLSEARYRITGYYEISGAELIRMGYNECERLN